MGVAHKLNPEVKNFIVEQKNSNLALSCRRLTALVLDNYKIELSKSSINMIIKEAGLSAPVGRRPKKKRQHIVMPSLPVLLEDTREIACLPDRQASVASLPRNDEAIVIAKPTEPAEVIPVQEENVVIASAEGAKQSPNDDEAGKAHILEEELKQEEIKKAQELAEQEIKAETEKLRARQLEEERKRQEEAQRKAEEEKGSAEFNIERLAQLGNTGILFLRAIDSIIGLSKLFSSAIKGRFPNAVGSFDDLVENLIYLPLLEGKIGKTLEDKLSGCLNQIENVKVMNMDISRLMSQGLQEARCVKVNLSDGSSLYLDGQFYSAWSSPYIPYDFASPVHNLKKQINKYLNTDFPFILFNAPGYDIPSQEFFNFLGSLDAKSNSINSLTIYGNKLEELDILPISQTKKQFFIFGVWPWQFTECRKVKSIGEFKPCRLQEQEKDVFIAEIEMELRNPGTGKQMSLKGCALKTSLSEKTRLVILSNFSSEEKKAEEIASFYLNRWPNLDEAFQDYSRKIELFTYTANSQRFFNAANLNLGLEQALSVKELLQNYLAALDAYLRWHFLPAGYEDKGLAVTLEQFYDLGARIIAGEITNTVEFILPKEGYFFGKDLAYLCRRLNERDVVLDGKRFLARA